MNSLRAHVRGGVAGPAALRQQHPQQPQQLPLLVAASCRRAVPCCPGSAGPSPACHVLPAAQRCARPGRCTVAARAQSAAGAAAPRPGSGASSGGSSWQWAVLGVAAVAGAAYMMTEPGLAMRTYLANGPLGRSGFLAAFSLIILSEIGDKTFFIAALLAMKVGKWVAFLGSVAALSVMTIISVGIGAVFSRVPDALKSSIPVGELAGVALLVFFGIKSLRDGLSKSDDGGTTSEEELADAEVVVQEAGGRGKDGSMLAVFFEVATLIFVAEWGDRSMLATIALGAAQSPVGVAVGAIAGHTAATGIAVLGGALASKYVSEKTINVASGLLFLLFAVATVYGLVVA